MPGQQAPQQASEVGHLLVKIRSGLRLWVLRCKERMTVEMGKD